ncbi:hypothetical protein J3E72DRAFT_26383 [Bipolaris maydis]|uniref:uncharacterized protein n=1 Tax=Cochliobolus heterostrophus TaxID=5016 RepID=UPI0024D53EFA|nr:hypothetical protein J3E73DRAFT_377919 [Bipolaris maydis]KAJ5046942.1 hypothetical protein J3E74DRAFT_31654 [Bipolaris maydis]KAJ5059960.1 hypothetical protein J3E74DRAFT_44188 [Bipolaris maydis]KAJ6202241.1 hypothetical protein J3E72DRAFT_26383 [Bipolaris maydis]KAJ6210746.1 hypothetical protein PSV09DRAFT_2030157 [Bipolaris maydis]
MSLPAHPAFVHFPITTTLLTGGLDAFYFFYKYPATSSAVASIYKTLDIKLAPQLFPFFSYYLTILTIAFSVPAVMTGASQLMPLIKRDGLNSRKAKMAIAHAAINDVTVVTAALNWWTRRSRPMFEPTSTNILASCVLALPATLFAAHLGGKLVYNYGMGFTGAQAKAKKSQ